MRNRANQRRVDDDEDGQMVALWDDDDDDPSPSNLAKYDFEFPDELNFPVLLLSYVGPQHGRFFYAYMVKDRLKIWQSRLYSFEQSPINLCTRVLLSCPVP
ncbi:hypothetical protein TCE0_044r16827 [Talaromyces pinophilus]|uniref:Uncharacterized protein n=1 Tax=Talaromyces pinophilus TaxID=128442 RepID=A0A478EBB5_TALPI|nr:hypothetical protein TCE0_044r16827 [Talaromyces pinophilus]